MPKLRDLAGGPRFRLAAAIVLVLLGAAAVGVRSSEYFARDRAAKDFAIDYSSARALIHGRDPFEPIRSLVARELHAPPDVVRGQIVPGRNWHPPLKIVLVAPFALLPFAVAGLLWLAVSVLAFLTAVAVFGKEVGWSRGVSLVLGAGALALPVVQKDLSLGQVNCVLLLLVVLAWRALRRDHERHAGLALGVAVALKVFPAFLLLPLVGARRLRAVVTAIGLAAIVSIAAMALIGFHHLPDVVQAGSGSYGLSHWESSPHNVSWWGPVTRWLTVNPWVANVGLDALGRVVAIAGSLILATWALHPSARLSGDPLHAAVPLMLLAWPITWDHYAVLALPWVALAGREVLRRGGPVLTLGFAIAVLGMVTGLPPRRTGEHIDSLRIALVYQLPTVALLSAVLVDRFASRPMHASLGFEPTAHQGP